MRPQTQWHTFSSIWNIHAGKCMDLGMPLANPRSFISCFLFDNGAQVPHLVIITFLIPFIKWLGLQLNNLMNLQMHFIHQHYVNSTLHEHSMPVDWIPCWSCSTQSLNFPYGFIDFQVLIGRYDSLACAELRMWATKWCQDSSHVNIYAVLRPHLC